MFDYNRGYADDLEASGIMDIFRLPKPAYYFYQSQRDANDPFGKPMVYIANNWQKNSPLDIRIFSNCDEVELFLNGKRLGKQIPNKDTMSTNLKHPPFTFTIPKFVAGTLEAKGYLNKKLVVSDIRKTPLAPKNIKIVIDKEYQSLEKLDSDVFFVHAYITDKNGTVTPNFNGEITFTVDKGNAQIIGENTVSVESGIASILLKVNGKTKNLKIKAESLNKNLSGVLKIDE